MKKSKSKKSLASRNARTGRLFILPFYIGFFLFFAKPLFETLTYVFSKVNIGSPSVFVGMDNIKYIFTEDLNYSKNLLTSVVDLFWKTPIIVIMSLFVAIIINSKFKGRTFVRAVFFMPVIVVTGIVVLIIQSDAAASGVLKGGVVSYGSIEYSAGLRNILVQADLSSQLVNIFTNISNSMFNLLWKIGVQMIIFLAGLQSIPGTLYEASSIEGASAWENFFKITVPMVSPIILVNLVYTIVDSFTDPANLVMNQIYVSASQIKLDISAAMSWVYFVIIAIILSIVGLIFNQFAKKLS